MGKKQFSTTRLDLEDIWVSGHDGWPEFKSEPVLKLVNIDEFIKDAIKAKPGKKPKPKERRPKNTNG